MPSRCYKGKCNARIERRRSVLEYAPSRPYSIGLSMLKAIPDQPSGGKRLLTPVAFRRTAGGERTQEDDADAGSYSRWLRGVARPAQLRNGFTALTLLLLLLNVCARTVADPDLYGHLRFGLDTLKARTIVEVDPYSYMTGGQRWVNHEWLSEVLAALAWTFGGAPGLIALKTVLCMLTLGVGYQHLRKSSVEPLRAAVLVFALCEVLMPFWGMARPQLFTALAFALVLHVISLCEAGHFRWSWTLPPIMLFWVNLHGGFLAGLVVLFAWTVLRLVLKRRTPLFVYSAVGCAAFATLANPYHIHLLGFLLRTATVPRPEITDWQPMQWKSLLGIMYLALLSVSVGALFCSRRKRELIPSMLFGIVAVLPFLAVRHILLGAIAAVMLIGIHMADGMERLSHGKSVRPGSAHWRAGTGALLVLLLASWRPSSFREIELIDGFYPVAAAELLKQSHISGNLAAHFPWGEYVIWHLGPAVKVAVDGRRETVYSEEAYRTYMHFHYGLNRWDALLDEYPTDMALVHKGTPAHARMRSRNGWYLAFEDNICALFVHERATYEKLLKGRGEVKQPGDNLSFP